MSKRPGTISNENAKPLAKKAKFVYWSTALVRSMEDPKLIVRGDDLVTVIKDAYPKAEFHYLILPKQDITSLKVLTKEHIELLKHMDKVAKEVINQDQHKNKKFNLGYHAEPSLARLHLHIISDDMNSPCVKTKKHWNSFTSEFFLKSEDVIKSLETHGKATFLPAETCKKLLNLPLKCHKCDYSPKHMPDLKKHIVSHV